MQHDSSSYAKEPRHNHVAIAFFSLVAISAVVRLLMMMNFRARASFDTPGFIITAQALASGDFSHYDGKRTPIYPLLMLLTGMDWPILRTIQSLLGIAIASMVFAITWVRTRSATASFIAGLLSSIAISELLYEQIVYSETLCTFWLVLSILAFARIALAERERQWEFALLGISAAVAGMTRPMFLYLGPLFFFFLAMRRRRLHDIRTAMVLAPTLLLALGWSAVNKYTINYFGVTTTTGYNLSNHSGAFMELAPPGYSQIADIYLRYRAWQIQQMGSQTMTIWYAENEIKRKTGLTTAELSKRLTRMSLEMFAEHPILYLESVAQAWMRFWGADFYHFVGFYQHEMGSSAAYAAVLILGTVQLVINVMFLIIAAYSIAQRWIGRISFNFDLGVIAIVLTGSIVQAFLEYGENVRYLAPLVPLTIYIVVTFVRRALDSRSITGRIQS
jgi:4-amino-4-deoxy-L-arabinose transferase-like glycosyltransferase